MMRVPRGATEGSSTTGAGSLEVRCASYSMSLSTPSSGAMAVLPGLPPSPSSKPSDCALAVAAQHAAARRGRRDAPQPLCEALSPARGAQRDEAAILRAGRAPQTQRVALGREDPFHIITRFASIDGY